MNAPSAAALDIACTLGRLIRDAQDRRHDWDGKASRQDAEIAFICHKRGVVLGAVNDQRTRRGLPPVTGRDVDYWENMSIGFGDPDRYWASKCALLATGELDVRA